MSWKSNEQLWLKAADLGDKIIGMYDTVGILIPETHYPDGAHPEQGLRDSLVLDATDYMSMDPDRLEQEYLEIQRAANQTGESPESIASLDVALTKISSAWTGTAADEFAKQMSRIRSFMVQQRDRILLAAQAVGAVYSLAVQFRQSWYDLADGTIQACRNVIDQQKAIEAKSRFSLGESLVQAVIGLFSIDKQTIANLLTKAIDSVTQDALTKATGEDINLDGEAEQVVWNYANGRDKLRQSFEAGLDELRKWLVNQVHELDQTAIPIVEPRQGVMDIRGPDFRYENFANEDRDPGSFGPNVDRERQEYLDELPDGVISQRLAGER